MPVPGAGFVPQHQPCPQQPGHSSGPAAFFASGPGLAAGIDPALGKRWPMCTLGGLKITN